MLSYWCFFSHCFCFLEGVVSHPCQTAQNQGAHQVYTRHMAIVMITLTFSMISIGVAFGTGGYVIYILIPGLSSCITRSPDAYFYSFVLLLCIVYTIGMTLIILILWRILRMRLHLSGQVCMGTLKVFEILIIMVIILANQ